LGDISFSIYLSHAIILSGAALLAVSLRLDHGSLFARTIFLIVVCAASLGVSYLAWQAIERPGQAAGRAWQRRLARRPATGELVG
jgi:peptidoglycan/LPS O-acetylase OafA/YrhL